jgi:integrase
LGWNIKLCFKEGKRVYHRLNNEGDIQFIIPHHIIGLFCYQFSPKTIRQLSAHRKRQDAERLDKRWKEHDLIFPSARGTPLDHRNLFREFKDLLKSSGLPDIRFHDLRHTAATLMLLNGIPLLVVSRRLGHAKPSVTLDVYGHYLPGMQDGAAALMDELVTPLPTQLQQNCSRQAPPRDQVSFLTPDVAVEVFRTATYTVTDHGLEP